MSIVLAAKNMALEAGICWVRPAFIACLDMWFAYMILVIVDFRPFSLHLDFLKFLFCGSLRSLFRSSSIYTAQQLKKQH